MIYEFIGYKPVIHKTSFVHLQATVTGNVIIGKNVYIGPGAAIRGDWGQIIIKKCWQIVFQKVYFLSHDC